MIPALLPPRRRATARLPPGRDDRPQAPTRDAPDAPPNVTPARPGEAAAAPFQILIVDDDPLFAQMLPRLLQRSIAHPPLDIVGAATPDDARRHLDGRAFDLLLCDFDLRAPRNGIDVLADASRSPRKPLRVLFSGHLPHEIGEIPAETVDAYLDKPATLRECVPLLRALIEERLGIPVLLREG